MMSRILTVIALAGLLSGCAAQAQLKPSISDQDAFALARKRVIENLKDPSSAQFGQHFERRTHSAAGTPWDRVCGTVNATNSFGAYTGMQIFVYQVADDFVVIGDRASVRCRLDLP